MTPAEAAAAALAAELFDQHLGGMDGRGLSAALHAMVVASYEPAKGLRGRVVSAVLADGGARLRGDRAEGTSKVLWALAMLRQDRGEQVDPAGVAALVGMARSKLQEPGQGLKAQDLATMAWALAVLGHEDRAFMDELLAEAEAQLHGYTPQELCIELKIMANHGLALPPAFLGAYLVAAGAQLPAFQPQHISNTASALAKLSLHVDGESRSLVELLGQPPSAQPGWPRAQLRRFLGAFGDEAARRLGPAAGSPAAARWDSMALANTIWALSELRHFHAGLWGAVAAEALARAEWGRGLGGDSGWTRREVSNLALGLARLSASEGGAPDPILAQLLPLLGCRQAAKQPPGFSAQDVCNLAWAHAAGGAPYCAWLMEGLVLPLRGAADLTVEEKSQLLQYLLAMERPGSGMPPAVAQRPEYRLLRQLGVGGA